MTTLISLLWELIFELTQGRWTLVLVSVFTSISDTMSMKLETQIVDFDKQYALLYVPLFDLKYVSSFKFTI